jgi:hypothetical protein
MIIEALLEKNTHLLPRCRYEGNKLLVHVPETPPDGVEENKWMDIANFNKRTSAIMSKSALELSKEESRFRYFVCCLTLYSKLALGRNEIALRNLILQHDRYALSFEVVFSVIKAEALPQLIRAQYTALVMRLYIDRDPVAYCPTIQYTRRFCVANKQPDKGLSKIQKLTTSVGSIQALYSGITSIKKREEGAASGSVEASAMKSSVGRASQVETAPRASAENFSQVAAFVLSEIPKLGGAT